MRSLPSPPSSFSPKHFLVNHNERARIVNRSGLQRDVRRPPSPNHARARSRRERERERERELELELEPEPTPTTTPTPSSPASKLHRPELMSALWVAGCAHTVIGPFPVALAAVFTLREAEYREIEIVS